MAVAFLGLAQTSPAASSDNAGLWEKLKSLPAKTEDYQFQKGFSSPIRGFLGLGLSAGMREKIIGPHGDRLGWYPMLGLRIDEPEWLFQSSSTFWLGFYYFNSSAQQMQEVLFPYASSDYRLVGTAGSKRKAYFLNWNRDYSCADAWKHDCQFLGLQINWVEALEDSENKRVFKTKNAAWPELEMGLGQEIGLRFFWGWRKLAEKQFGPWPWAWGWQLQFGPELRWTKTLPLIQMIVPDPKDVVLEENAQATDTQATGAQATLADLIASWPEYLQKTQKNPLDFKSEGLMTWQFVISFSLIYEHVPF